ncbi:bcl-2-interacting killer [Cololabis saira]|uniref:bcl-2-interacting killer n=1 Tax=Cololabis saira TaxID=129043 RepID=UPI002AD22BCD|nr:bcl-2-interacting killer [Cololabis saira]
MVEQTRRQSRAVSLRAGPGEVDAGSLSDVNLRISDRAARACGRQLAIIGDQMVRERARRDPTWQPLPLHLLRPAQTLRRTIYRDIQSQLWGFQSLFAAVKAWIVSTTPGQGILRTEAFTARMSHFKAVVCAGWAGRALMTVALVATVSIVGALWLEEES